MPKRRFVAESSVAALLADALQAVSELPRTAIEPSGIALVRDPIATRPLGLRLCAPTCPADIVLRFGLPRLLSTRPLALHLYVPVCNSALCISEVEQCIVDHLTLTITAGHQRRILPTAIRVRQHPGGVITAEIAPSCFAGVRSVVTLDGLSLAGLSLVAPGQPALINVLQPERPVVARGDLWPAVLAGDVDRVVAALVAAAADPDEPDREGNTPLHAAASLGHVEIIRALLDGGADPSALGTWSTTPLIKAVTARRLEVAALLLSDERVDANAATDLGFTALHIAAAAGSAALVSLLLSDPRVDPNPRTLESGATAQQLAEAAGHNAVAALIAADPRVVDADAAAIDDADAAPPPPPPPPQAPLV